jgi:hypothetical protein
MPRPSPCPEETDGPDPIFSQKSSVIGKFAFVNNIQLIRRGDKLAKASEGSPFIELKCGASSALN